ncbi:hypothetical protein ACQ4WX_21735 [Streptomyces lasalocidi]
MTGANGSDRFARIHLSLTEPELFLQGYTLDELSIALDDKHACLYEDGDPDTCPAFRLRQSSR